MRARSVLKFIAIAIIVLIVLGYGFAKTRDLIFGTNLIIETPVDGSTVLTEVIEIKGNARSAVKLEINGKEVITDESGYFQKRYVLANGYNVINVSATDRFGRVSEEKLRLNYEGENYEESILEEIPTNTEIENTSLNSTTTEQDSGSSTEEVPQ